MLGKYVPLFATLLAPYAHAQVFKCDVAGKRVYQQEPCDQVAGAGGKMAIENAPLSGAAEFTKIPVDVPRPGRELCLKSAPHAASWKDRDSLKIGDVIRLGAQTIKVDGQHVKAHTYSMKINGKNTYGAYAGEKLYLCYVSPDESKLLAFKAVGDL
jgi:hypothetical protein